MRPAFACLLALGLAHCAPAAPPTPAAPARVAEEPVPDAPFCARPNEKAAFQVAALKSRLMVTALACNADGKYNAFIAAHRAGLLPQEKVLGSYFARNYGRRGQVEHDEYITALANAQSRRRTIDVANFCQDGEKLFADVAALKSPAELPPLAGRITISQPMNVTECPVQVAEQAPQRARTAPRRSGTAAKR